MPMTHCAACFISVAFGYGHNSTGKERDTETGLDYFGARYYASNVGRWLSPDWSAKPEAVPYSDLTDPQSLNLYSYVRNGPLSRTDPDGHCGKEVNCWPTQKDPDPKKDKAQQTQKEQGLTNVVYNETASLKPNTNAKPGEKGSAEDLASGRQAVAEVANRVIDAGHPDRVAPSTLTDKATNAIKNGDPSAVDAHNKSQTAADAALGGSNITNGATQYRTRVGDNVTTPVGKSSSNPGTPVSSSYGPFSEGKHTVVIVVAP